MTLTACYDVCLCVEETRQNHLLYFWGMHVEYFHHTLCTNGAQPPSLLNEYMCNGDTSVYIMCIHDLKVNHDALLLIPLHFLAQ